MVLLSVFFYNFVVSMHRGVLIAHEKPGALFTLS